MQPKSRLTLFLAQAFFLSQTLLGANATTPDPAMEGKQAIPQDDVVMQAMKDELDRTKSKLKLEKFATPYFVSYNITDSIGFFLGASFGAITNKSDSNSRFARTVLRIGDKKLDSDRGSTFMFGDRTFVLDDDYDAIRNALWLSSDRSYKSAVENLESKKATRQYTKVEDQPDSFSDAKTVVSVKDVKNTPIDQADWEDRLRKISAIFKEYPDITQSGISFSTRKKLRRLVNSEGTTVKDQEAGANFRIEATAQAKDGMETSDDETFSVNALDQLPDQKTMEESARKVASRAIELSKAKRASDYLGPILFEKDAAADLVSSVISPLVVADRADDIGFFRSSQSDKKIGQRLFPEFLSIIDDPTAKTYKDLPLKGGWEIDDEGVRAQKLTLIDKGILKAVCSTRKPTRLSKESNGHNRGGTACPGHLFIETSQPMSMSDMKKKLIETAKAQGLTSALIIRKTQSGYMGIDFSGISGFQIISSLGGSRSSSSFIYSVDVNTGKEELVRGAQLRRLTRQDLRNMLAAGNDANTYVAKYPSDYTGTAISLVTPSLLFGELEIQKPPLETDTPPHLKNPYFDEKK
jgi:predicted Zn-dependent protease